MLLGLAFECRYQVAFMIAGIFLWLIGHAKTSFRTLLILLLGLSLSVGVGAWADHWGYGHWVFAPWNYFEFNIIQNHVSDMDTSPGWDYFRRAFTESWPFLGFLTLVSFPIFWVRYPKHILTWSVFPFFLIHVLIGHKELRFLFPMAHVAGVVLVLSIMPSSMPSPTSLPKGIKLIGTVLASFSLIGLVLQSLVPAWMPIRFYSHLSTLQTHKLSVYYKDDSFFNLGGARLYFYRPKNAQFIPYENADPILKALHDSKEPLWIFSARRIFPKDLSLVQEKCRIEFSTLPNWIENTKFRKDLNERITNWTLFRCQA
jgi:GPI mannosyltransferase 3